MIYPDEEVQVIDPRWSKEKRRQVEEENRQAKLRHAARREEERINKPNLIDKIYDLVGKIKTSRREKKKEH